MRIAAKTSPNDPTMTARQNFGHGERQRSDLRTRIKYYYSISIRWPPYVIEPRALARAAHGGFQTLVRQGWRDKEGLRGKAAADSKTITQRRNHKTTIRGTNMKTPST